jgi:AcrR family transcriptional regulator
MGIPERKARHRSDLRRRILAEAERLFVRDGYENVSMRKIAARIEYSPTTIYRVFRDKAEVMEHLLAEGYQGVRRRYEAILADRPASPLETLRLILREYIAYGVGHPNHYRLYFATGELRASGGRLQMRHGSTTYQVYQTWLERIDECKAAGLLPARDTLELFQLIWAAVHGLISLRIHHPRFPWPPLEAHVAALLSLVEHGLAGAAAPAAPPPGGPAVRARRPRGRAGRSQ